MKDVDKSIWDLRGSFEYSSLNPKQKKELDVLIEDMKAIYGLYRPIQVKYIIEKINKAKGGNIRQYSNSYSGWRGSASSYRTEKVWITEWDLKHFVIIQNEILEHNNTTIEEVRSRHDQLKEEIEIALNYIAGIFKNARIWKGHIDLLRSYKHQLEAGLPLTDRQADTVIKLLRRYSKQVVSNELL